jgi:dethiobiotin synthetase
VNGVFVTGTDTNVGKTHVACALARRAHARGHKVFAFKPIETGCTASETGGYLGADQELLAVAAGDWQTGALRGVYRFPLPAAPLVAAQQVGSAIDLDLVERTARDGAARSGASWTLVEGAGGWRVPITPGADMAALAHRLQLPVLVVARAGLGTINHSLLTLEAVERDGLSVAGLVLSRHETDDPAAAESNLAQIQRRWSGTILILSTDPLVLDPLLPTARRLAR